MKKALLITAAFLLLSSSLGSLAPQNGYDQFQKALAKERGEGNLEEAIALYQKVIEETKDESLAAQAQLRIGICYEKLGQEKAKLAQEAFQKVVDRYRGQIATVKTAREKLMLLLRAQSAVEKGTGGLSMRSLLAGEKAELAQVSPDSHLVAYFNYGEGTMAVHDLTTGKTRLLNSRLEKDEPAGECWSFRWSRGGDALVCSWWQWSAGRWADMRMVYLNGSAPRILVRGDFEDAYVFDWSPDGSMVVARSENGQLLRWRLDEPQADPHVVSAGESSTAVVVSTDGKLLATGCEDGRVIVRNAATFAVEFQHPLPQPRHARVRFCAAACRRLAPYRYSSMAGEPFLGPVLFAVSCRRNGTPGRAALGAGGGIAGGCGDGHPFGE